MEKNPIRKTISCPILYYKKAKKMFAKLNKIGSTISSTFWNKKYENLMPSIKKHNSDLTLLVNGELPLDLEEIKKKRDGFWHICKKYRPKCYDIHNQIDILNTEINRHHIVCKNEKEEKKFKNFRDNLAKYRTFITLQEKKLNFTKSHCDKLDVLLKRKNNSNNYNINY